MKKIAIAIVLLLLTILPLSACIKETELSNDEAMQILKNAARNYISEEEDIKVTSEIKQNNYDEFGKVEEKYMSERVGQITYNEHNPTIYFYSSLIL
ncbi:MAG: hypothetical protein WC292_01440 [Clostridia bacterium]